MIIVVSGYFDPVHVGHIECLELAKNFNGENNFLICLINNDKQAILKKGKPFMSEEDRMKIMSALKNVNEVFLSVDEDSSVCKSILALYQKKPFDIFAKGGDRYSTEIPEKEICDQLGIKIVDGLGAKIRASSDLIKNIK